MRTETKQQIDAIDQGNPPSPAAGIFGLTIPPEEAALVLVPVPWEATTSYGQGTAHAPHAMVEASHQMDLFDLTFGKPFRQGITMLEEEVWIRDLNFRARQSAEKVITAFENQMTIPEQDLQMVNQASDDVNHFVYQTAKKWLDLGKEVGVVGGDHSSPLGLMRALSEKYPNGFGILHFDAHHDLRDAYEGFKYSHASIMFNALESIPEINKLVSVGIRDFSRDEYQLAHESEGRVETHYAENIFKSKASGISFQHIVDGIIASLPKNVYVSFDIDAFEPDLCPSTGTPVPGGFSFYEGIYFLERLVDSGRRIIGFDLCEVAPSPNGDDEWDANVGARVLYKLCGAQLRTKGI